MRFQLITAALFLGCWIAPRECRAQTPPSEIMVHLKPTHPRLIANAGSWEEINSRRKNDAEFDAFLKRSEFEARALLTAPPIPYHKDGKRLLRVSRIVLRRVLLLSLQYRLTRDKALAARAEQEMLNVAAFADWNPSHFLDVGEMTTALAFGYDWLYNVLDENARATIRTAIVEKGLRPSLENQFSGWKTWENNWNSVCLAGTTLGALAVAESEPVLASQILQRTKDFNFHGLKTYAPAGVYPEGANYWGYGTTFQAILINALETSIGTDWGISQSPGFMQSADAMLQQCGPTGAFFDFSDGTEWASLEGGNYWYAYALKRPELANIQAKRIRDYANSKQPSNPDSENDRLLPLIALWWPEKAAAPVTPPPLNWYGPGPNPLAAFRTAWNDSNAMFLALKGGKAANSHGHMDAGSFVFEADGIRWARDLGMQSYLGLESKGIDLWNSSQEGGRWSVFRLNNLSHNTLTIDGQPHQVNGMAKIIRFSDGKEPGAIVDLSPTFSNQAGKVTRGFAFRPNHVLIKDELEGLKLGDTIRWAMLTDATVEMTAHNEALLTQGGKQLHVYLDGPAGAKFEVISADPHHDFDEPNPKSRILIVNFQAPPSGKLAWSVSLQPGSVSGPVQNDPLAYKPLAEWSMPATVN